MRECANVCSSYLFGCRYRLFRVTGTFTYVVRVLVVLSIMCLQPLTATRMYCCLRLLDLLLYYLPYLIIFRPFAQCFTLGAARLQDLRDAAQQAARVIGRTVIDRSRQVSALQIADAENSAQSGRAKFGQCHDPLEMVLDDVRTVLEFARTIRIVAPNPACVDDVARERDGLALVRAESEVRHVAAADQNLIAPHVHDLVCDCVLVHEVGRREDGFGVVAKLRDHRFVLLEQCDVRRRQQWRLRW